MYKAKEAFLDSLPTLFLVCNKAKLGFTALGLVNSLVLKQNFVQILNSEKNDTVKNFIKWPFLNTSLPFHARSHDASC